MNTNCSYQTTRGRFLILITALALASTPIVSFSQSYVPGRLTVVLKPEALDEVEYLSDGTTLLPNATSLNSLNSQYGLIAMRAMSKKAESPFRFFFDFEFDEEATLSTLQSAYAADSFVSWVSPIPIIGDEEPLSDPYYPNDPAFPSLWYLNDSTTIADIDAPEAWEWTRGSSNITIAICAGGIPIDSTSAGYYGYAADVARNVWTNPNETLDSIDNDGNGFVDDLHGWNVYLDNNDIEARLSQGTGDNNFYSIGHGRDCAKFAAARIDQTTAYGWVGVAPECRIIGLTYPRGTHNSVFSAWSIIYAFEQGASVLSFSFTLTPSYYQPFVDTAFAHGMLFVNAFGNTSGQTYDVPPYGISAQSLNRSNQQYPGAPTGSNCRISANSSYAGSSYAAPIVAGVIGLMKSINPYLTATELRQLLLDSSSVNPTNGTGLGVGRTNAFKAIRNAAATPHLENVDRTEPDERGFIHPILNWTPNPLISGSVISEYIIQKRRPSENVFQDIDSVSGSITSYTDITEYIPTEWSPWAATEYRVRAKLTYGSSVVLSVASNVQFVGSAPIEKPNAPTASISSPTTTRLLGNYPNPFNPSTTIGFDLAQDGFVSLLVFNLLGQEVSTLVSSRLQPGRYTVLFDASSLSSGVYYYYLQAGGIVQTRKLLLCR